MAIIYLVRHGRTDFIGKKLCGNLPGIHLNEEGRVQAQKAAGYLSNFPIKAIYSSPIERAMETAQIIVSKSGLEIDPVDFLREIHFGDLQGMGGKDLTDHPLWIKFNSEPGDIRFPNGESVSEVYDRVSKGLGLISHQYDKEDQFACVAHSDVLRLAICWVLDLPLDNFHQLTIDPASISKIEITPERKKLRLLNLQPD